MNDNKDTQKNINNYIDVFTSDEVKVRGEKLYSRGLVDFKVYEERTDTWKFFVKGTQLYRVSIRGVKKDEIEASCTCPYSFGGICKHTVASMLYILGIELSHTRTGIEKQIDTGHEKRGGRVIKQTSAGATFELEEYAEITKEFVLDNISQRVYNQLTFYSNFIELINYSIKPEKACFNFLNEGDEVDICFFKEDDKIWVSTTEFSQNDTFTHTLAYCLLLIAKSATPKMLNTIFNGDLKRTEESIIDKYGLPENTEYNLYFEHRFDIDSGLISFRKLESRGLIPVKQEEIDPLISFLNKQASFNLEEESFLKNKNRLEVAFLLRLSEDVGHDESNQNYYHIVPIVGKANKFGQLTTHIATFNTYEHKYALKSDRVSRILHLLNYNDDANIEKIEFNTLKAVFNLLKQEKYVYGLKANTYTVKKTNLQAISLANDEIDLVFDICEENGFLSSKLKIKKGNEVIEQDVFDASISSPELIVIDNTFHIVKNNKVCQYLASYPNELQMVANEKTAFFSQIVMPISKQFDLIFNDHAFLIDKIELDFNKKQLFLSEQDEYIIITPQVEYENDITALLHSPGNILIESDDKIIEYKRNHELEEDFLDSIAELHPEFESQKSSRVFYLHHTEFAKNMWFYRFFEQLKVRNVEVYGLKELKKFKYSPYKGKVDTNISSGQDWFEIDINVSFGDNKVALTDIRKAVINKQRYIQLSDGSVGVLPTEWYSKLEKYFRNGEVIDDKLIVSKLKFSIIDEMFDTIDDEQVVTEIAQKRKKLESFTEISATEIPNEITATLRHYQKEGLNWLHFLHEMQWGGILADDMGLGKTLQILTFIQHLKNIESSTHLIVVPTTLLFNWEREIEKFAPELKAFYHYGIDRQKDTAGFEDYDLVFTTYGLLLRDIEMLRQFEFNYIILDESQAIKNPASRRYKAANLVNAKNRIALSGTPIENSTFDLFAQMSFANRGFFSGVAAFKENYSNPIDKDGNEAIGGELHRIINPFILRRTKETVATELPDKTEDVIYCEMEPDQRRVYDAYRNSYRNQLISKMELDGVGKSKMMVLEALTRLRQICDSPALVDQDYVSDAQAVKVKEIVRHITNKTANHKILIFSQFVKMLGIVKNELTKLNIDFEYLDGKSTTRQREKSVNNFQENDDLRVFLISLKAGGTGLNLTAADYVYLLDPWWNPAVENQAIDRCYRIGQDKKVFAYRMICKDTVEEKILNLQNKKKKIAGDIIQTDENIMKTLSSDDIKDLFA